MKTIPTDQGSAASSVLSTHLELPCGATLKNRMVKAAMSDGLGDGRGNPTEPQIRLYERWTDGGTALSIIGEVQGTPFYPEKPGNLVLGSTSDIDALRSLTARSTAGNTHLWPQLGHAGALAYAPISNPKGPSSLDLPGLRCGALTVNEIEALPEMYAQAAKLARSVGFTGVHLHAGHGFLLNQFLSPLFNRRTDQFGGSVEARSRIVVQILNEIRETVGPSFPIGIKINSTDKLEGGLTEHDALEFVRILDRTSVDLIDVSGGTYFPGAKASSDGIADDGPYFINFARKAKSLTNVPIMLTGGFRTRAQASNALETGAVDAVGLARAMVLSPELPNIWLTEAGGDPVFPRFNAPPRGGITAWFTMRMTEIGENRDHETDVNTHKALQIYDDRDSQRSAIWSDTFPILPA